MHCTACIVSAVFIVMFCEKTPAAQLGAAAPPTNKGKLLFCDFWQHVWQYPLSHMVHATAGSNSVI